MPKENSEAKLKLVHLVYGMFAAAVMIGIAIGSMMKQQSTNTGDIKAVESQKVEKEIFKMHKF